MRLQAMIAQAGADVDRRCRSRWRRIVGAM
jgi:hypothetical protein